MKLREFITSVLVDIENGVNDAARQTKKYTYLNTMGTKGDEGVIFDVAVTAGGEVSGKIGAEVLSIGTKAEGRISNEEVSRVRFRVNMGQYFKK